MESITYVDTVFKRSHLSDKELYLLMGYEEHIPSEDILETIEEIFLHLQSICKPRYSYRLCKGGVTGKGRVEIEGITFQTGHIISTAMKEAQQIALFTITVGEEFDDWFHQLREKDDIVYEFIANSVGSILAEGIVGELLQHLEERVSKQGLFISYSYSPGYCDWMLIEQRKLFSILPSSVSGVELTDSCLMLPVKSVSGIISVGPNVKKRAYRCDICKMTTCVRNKKRASFTKEALVE